MCAWDMCMHMCRCIWTHTALYTPIRAHEWAHAMLMYISTFTYTHVSRWICWHKHNRCVHIHTYMKLFMFLHICMCFIHMYMYMWTCTHMCICTPTTPVPPRNHQIPVACMWMYLLAWYQQSHWSCSSMRPAPSSKPKMLQHPSLLHRLHPAHGRCMPQTSEPWKELTTSYVVTSLQRWSSSDAFYLARATPPKSSRCSRKCFQST